MSAHPLSIVDVASHLPERIVDNSFFIQEEGRSTPAMFKGTRLRRHLGRAENAADQIAQAARTIVDRVNLDPARDIDVIVTNVSIPDQPFTGCGAVVAKHIGARPSHIVDMANGGCISFVFMLEQVRWIFAATGAKTALICNGQTAGGRMFAQEANRKLPQSAVPGDGCGVAYVVANDDSPVLSIVTRNHPDYAEDMSISCGERLWWEPREMPMSIEFTESRVASIVGRGNRLVPEALSEAMTQARLTVSDVGCLVTNQPNRIFLRNWREAIQLPADKHVDTFEEYGNLFGAAVPVNMAHALQSGQLKDDSVLMLGGFSHAGDYAAAAAVHWRRGSAHR
jgi:3-oxoacyl-[acyl-carrier-protein] synthase-3